jgi:hypothetical protein
MKTHDIIRGAIVWLIMGVPQGNIEALMKKSEVQCNAPDNTVGHYWRTCAACKINLIV